MCEGEYRYDFSLKLKPEVTFEEAEQLADLLWQNTMNEIVKEISVDRIDGCYAIGVDDALFEGDRFESTLLESEMLPKVQDQVYSCYGQDQKFFFRVNNGVIEECETIQTPSNDWHPFFVPEGVEHV